MSTDESIVDRIERLVEEERELRAGGLSSQDRGRIQEVEVELDRCWDLLRQRRAHRDAAEDPDSAEPRSPGTVETYLQ
ncbi:DUF2630 family protein [Nitriliruptoraceae bacterium ZYF776]|nr:DUF2630 family protein [Profundirhabdus halotolerans]